MHTAIAGYIWRLRGVLVAVAGLIAFNILLLIKEFRAGKLREERGLPTPVE